MHGIPVIVKDNYNTIEFPTTAGSLALAGFQPKTDAFQVARLKQAGAIILAKANMDELAAGIGGLSSIGARTKNPYDLTRSPGGSSGGTGAAITANFATIGMGTDTCGSIRIPSSFNNLVGLRPSKGLSSITGIVPLFPVYDVGGPMARTVGDIAIVMDVVAGYDSHDRATMLVKSVAPTSFVSQLKAVDLSNVRIGRLNGYFSSDKRSEVNAQITKTVAMLEKNGVTVVDIDTSLFDEVIDTINKYQFSHLLLENQRGFAEFLEAHPESGFISVSELVERGLYHEFLDKTGLFKNLLDSKRVGSRDEYYPFDFEAWRHILQNLIEQVMLAHDLDVFMYPTVQVLPVKIGGKQEGLNCYLSAYSGTPALALPVGFSETGLPIGVELLGSVLSDKKLLAIGYAIEQVITSRRLPSAAPALTNGNAPDPIAFQVGIDHMIKIDFELHTLRNELHYEIQWLSDDELYAACLHQGIDLPVIQCLSGPDGKRLSGKVRLNYKHIQALQKGELYLRAYDSGSPTGKGGCVSKTPAKE